MSKGWEEDWRGTEKKKAQRRTAQKWCVYVLVVGFQRKERARAITRTETHFERLRQRGTSLYQLVLVSARSSFQLHGQ